MQVHPIFNFTGTILPILDKTDKLSLLIINDGNDKILLNIVSSNINSFITIPPTETKIIPIEQYSTTGHIKIFYMGRELFDFKTTDIEKEALKLYSNHIIKYALDINKVAVSLSFLDGITITTKSNKPQNLFIQIIDRDTNQIIHENNFISGIPYKFEKLYYVNYQISILNSTGKIIFNYNLNLKNKPVWIKFDSKALGDTLAWMPYVEKFRQKHNCKILCTTYWNDLFIKTYPKIEFVNPESTVRAEDLFSIYTIQCSIPFDNRYMPMDYRDCALQEMAANSLGLVYTERKPKIHVEKQKRFITGKYVVISTMATSKAKLWNNPKGWQEVIDYITAAGYKVVLLQSEPSAGFKNIINLSGNTDIQQAINVLKHCSFYIGLSSGLSWLAWALHKKVILISGFTTPLVEFKKGCYRVYNEDPAVCSGCWNNKQFIFDRNKWDWCPCEKNFECTTKITAVDVIYNVEKIILNRGLAATVAA